MIEWEGNTMSGDEYRELESSIAGVRRTCRWVGTSCKIGAVVFAIGWGVLIAIMLFDIAISAIDVGKAKALTYVLLHGSVIGALLLLSISVFSDVAKGEPPFSLKQAARLRAVGLLFAALVVVEAVLSYGFVYTAEVPNAPLQVYVAGAEQGRVEINVMAAFFAIMLLGLSMVFRYGALLQRLSDETG